MDYDLYFSDPLRSSAAQVVPFATNSAKSLTIAMWVQYTQQDEGGIFFTAYGVRYVLLLYNLNKDKFYQHSLFFYLTKKHCISVTLILH